MVMPIGVAFGVGRSNSVKLAAVRIETADLRRAAFAEPQAAVEAFHRDVGLAARCRDSVLADFGRVDRAGARPGLMDNI